VDEKTSLLRIIRLLKGNVAIWLNQSWKLILSLQFIQKQLAVIKSLLCIRRLQLSHYGQVIEH
jgi:hypothetical protein